MCLLIGSILIGYTGVWLLSVLFIALAIPELYRLLNIKLKHVVAYVIAFVVFISLNTAVIPPEVLLGTVPLLLMIILLKNHAGLVDDLGRLSLMILYFLPAISLLPKLYGLFEELGNAQFLIAVFALIWVNDTFAYLIGSAIGKRKLWPSVSPGKSWEGFIGGCIVTMAAGGFSSSFLTIMGPIEGVFLGAIICVAATFGDLFESSLKRRAGIKDSGNIMPGHGGILDRIDSILFVIPSVFTFFILLHKFSF